MAPLDRALFLWYGLVDQQLPKGGGDAGSDQGICSGGDGHRGRLPVLEQTEVRDAGRNGAAAGAAFVVAGGNSSSALAGGGGISRRDRHGCGGPDEVRVRVRWWVRLRRVHAAIAPRDVIGRFARDVPHLSDRRARESGASFLQRFSALHAHRGERAGGRGHD